MREYRILLRLQLSSLFGVNKIIHGRNTAERKKRSRGLLALVAMVISLLYASILYSTLIADALASTGQLPMLLTTMAAATIMLALVMTVFSTKGVLYGFGDYDTLMSWPVRVFAVAASRISAMYAYNLAYTLLLLLPAGVVYALRACPPGWYYPLLALLCLAAPALPTALGSLLGTLLTAVTVRLKNRSVLNAASQIVLVGALMVAVMRLNAGMNAQGEAMMALSAQMGGVCPPALWLQRAALGDVGMLLLLVLTGAAALALVTALLAKNFQSLNARLSAAPHAGAYRMGRQTRSGVVRALYRKEWKRYLGSTIWISNTAIGYVILLALAVVLGVVRPAAIEELIADPSMPVVRMLLPLLPAWLMTMSSTTSSAVSMEGRNLWIVKSCPVRARDWLLAKLLVSLTLGVPALAVFTVVTCIGLKSDALEWLLMFFLPLGYAVLSGVIGLAVNLRLPRFDWKTDTEIVKQSMSTLLSVLIGMVLAILPAAALLVSGSRLVMPAAAVLSAMAAWLVWRRLCRIGDGRLYRL